MLAGSAAEARAYREARETPDDTDRPSTRPSSPETGAIAEFLPGEAPTIRGTIPFKPRPRE